MNLFYFDKFLLLYLWFFIDISDCEDYLAKCSVNQPFTLLDSNCGSFEEVCIKKRDEQCDNLKNACQQCPSTNYTLPILVNILKMLKTEIYEMKLNQTAEIKTIKGLMIFLVVIVILLITLIVVEVRFKIITKGIQRKKKRTLTRKDNCNDNHSEISEPNTANEDAITEGQGTPFLKSRKLNDLGDVEKRLNDRLDKIASEINTNTNSKISNDLRNVENQLNDRLDRIASEISVDTNSKISDVLKSVKEQLNDHLDKISLEIRSIKNDSDIPEENKSLSTIDLVEIDKEHELESTANTENIEIKPITESDGNRQRISNEVNSRLSEENNDKVLGINHDEK